MAHMPSHTDNQTQRLTGSQAHRLSGSQAQRLAGLNPQQIRTVATAQRARPPLPHELPPAVDSIADAPKRATACHAAAYRSIDDALPVTNVSGASLSDRAHPAARAPSPSPAYWQDTRSERPTRANIGHASSAGGVAPSSPLTR